MGRRSINTTKSGKYMNPTDQARKEARKKELKKNKKQRQMVRAAVLKMKDPTQILEELEKIDEMEYNVIQPSPLNEKVLKEKRKKLRETFDRVLKMYDKDEPEKWVELKRQEVEYDKRRNHLVSYYESVKHAQAVHIDEIPLPTLQVPDNLLYGNMPSQIPLPMDIIPSNNPVIPVRPILKRNTAYKELSDSLEPPGVPPGPPPDLLDLLQAELGTSTITPTPRHRTLRFSEQPDDVPGEEPIHQSELEEKVNEASGNPDEEPERESEEVRPSSSPTLPPGLTANATNAITNVNASKPTSLQQRMLALSGQNIDEFMKEMEEVHKKREKDRADDLTMRLSALVKDRPQVDDDSGSDDDSQAVLSQNPFRGPPGSDDNLRKPPPLMATMFRPPPMRMPGLPPVPMRLPPGPPPGRPSLPLGPPGPPPGRPSLPPGPPPGLPPRATLRMPPGPPPGMPPRLIRPPMPPRLILAPVPVLTAAPQLINRKDQGATISAKPQIRNLSADVTRFVPSALRVKREDKKPRAGKLSATDSSISSIASGSKDSKDRVQPAGPTKDDAYMQFMREMQGLL